LPRNVEAGSLDWSWAQLGFRADGPADFLLGFRFGVRLVFAAVAGAPGDGGAAAMDDGCGARAEGGVFGFWYCQGFGAGSLPFAFGPFV
jgi:hypothetical protein